MGRESVTESASYQWGDLTRELTNEVPIGETHQFDWDLFKTSDDTNIQLLVKLIEKVDDTYLSIQNINAIKMEEEEE